MIRTAAIAFLLVAAATPAAAQVPAGASATLEMRQSLTVSTARPMAPNGEQAVSQVKLEDGVYQITGDPNRAYRVRTEAPEGEDAPVIRSSNTGEISEGGVGFLDADGRDTISIGSPGAEAAGRPPISVTIDYE